MPLPSGRAWCARFPTSTSLDDLEPSFALKVRAFLESLKSAGLAVDITATYRPPERAYLMHWAWLIARGDGGGRLGHGNTHAAGEAIPSMTGVDIQWWRPNDYHRAKERAAAEDMVRGFGMAFPAVLASRHTQRRAIDMTIHLNPKSFCAVRNASGVLVRANRQEDLWPIGASYGVHKLPSDPPHWSDDGH